MRLGICAATKAICQFDWAMIEAAQDLGANAVKTLVRVMFPLTAPGILAGSILVHAQKPPRMIERLPVSLAENHVSRLQSTPLKMRGYPTTVTLAWGARALMLA